MKNRIIIGLFLLITFCITPAFAQKKNPVSESQCGMYGRKDFTGTAVDINVVNTDIQNILDSIAKRFRCNFVVDKSVGSVPVTVTINNVPWNFILYSVLKSKSLAVQVNGSTLRVAQTKILEEESKLKIITCPLQEKAELLYTEIIKLKNLPCPNDTDCEEKSGAFNRLKTIITRRLTRRGIIEIDERSQTLIITDARSNLDSLISLVELLNNSDFYDKTEKNR